METLEVTRLSSKGQVVLPQAIRKRLRLTEGARFVVIGSDDTVILKRLEEPAREQAKELLKASRAYAKRVGLTPEDLKRAVQRAKASLR